jgi:hypothetical protein
MEKRQIKVGVHEGAGPSPGYKWHVWMLSLVHDEVCGFLNKVQYQHMAMQVKELAGEDDPTHSTTASVLPVEDYFELRDKGGVLGKKNVRVYFGIDGTKKSIVILGGIKKESDGRLPEGTRILMNRRWRKYKRGDYGQI